MKRFFHLLGERLFGPRLVGAPVMVLRPGDLLICQPEYPLAKETIEHFHKEWERRFGGYYPVAVLPGDWKISVASEEPAPPQEANRG